MSQFPRDEFDKVPETAARQGVHRERLVPPRSGGLALKILVGLMVLAVGFAAYFIFPRLGIGQASESAPETSSAAPSTPSTEETASAAPSEEPSPSEAPTPEPTPVETEPEAVVDRAQPVAVLNATTVAGLASTAAGRLQTDGWNVTQIANWAGQPVQSSLILYNGEEQRASAEELGRVLGITTVQGNAGFSENITVVVGPGFQ
ncbi:cytoskeletal protein RodZ [Arthrobacter pigmenti]|uniref:Cytoskeletal protein RodZ n=1 Tax=Arthrobacter pigmenti TaxID=271432 RepID=A0A846RQB4_9MICC|nr:LytR C-terminal domain-containing protein [Arthrobacter pigmenti]NJC21296.1 cytoskeletal protein RodZ [Arthrobacter pigmenti]